MSILNKKIRAVIYNKYNGRCAYTGVPLTGKWQIDHVEPRFYANMYGKNPDRIENLLPTLPLINHYKRCRDLESFRRYMLSFHLRLAKLPKKPRIDKSVRRCNYMYLIADAFGINETHPFNGKFYFETIN